MKDSDLLPRLRCAPLFGSTGEVAANRIEELLSLKEAYQAALYDIEAMLIDRGRALVNAISPQAQERTRIELETLRMVLDILQID